MSFKYINPYTNFQYLFTKELGNFRKVVRKAENDDVYSVETWKTLSYNSLHSDELVTVEYVSNKKLNVVLEKD